MARFSSRATIHASNRCRSCISADTASIGLLPGLDIRSPPLVGQATTRIWATDSGAAARFSQCTYFVAGQDIHPAQQPRCEKDSCRLLDTLHALVRDRQ